MQTAIGNYPYTIGGTNRLFTPFTITVSGSCSPSPFTAPATATTLVTWQYKDLTPADAAAVTSTAIPAFP